MPNKKHYPSWFSPCSKPRLFASKPDPVLRDRETVIGSEEISLEGERYILSHDEETKTTVYLETTVDYSGCCYEGDAPHVSMRKVTVVAQDVENPNYKRQLAAYEKAKKEFAAKRAEWTALKKRWDEEAARETEIREKEMLEQLKKKYE